MFNVNDITGSEILEMSKDNFRQKLSRARKQLANFMNDKCGLMKKDNPCHCNKKTKLMMDVGYVNPDNLLFSKNYVYTIENVAPQKVEFMDNIFEEKAIQLFREHPFQQSPDFVLSLNKILNNKEFRDVFNFN